MSTMGTMMYCWCLNLSDITILNINGTDYYRIISEISISDATNLMQNIDLTEKSGTL